MKLKLTQKWLAALLLSAMAVPTFAAENRPIRSAKDAVGCWERINFTPAFEKMVNPTEYFAGAHQWYCFEPNGNLTSMTSSEYSPQTSKDLRAILNKMPAVFQYSWIKDGVILTKTTPNNPPQTIGWQVTFTTEQKTAPDKTVMPKGTMIMGVIDPDSGKIIYWRYLKPLK